MPFKLGLVSVPLSFVIGAAASYAILYFAGNNPSGLPLLSAAIGLIVALFIPFWQAYFVQAPKLAIEISAIKRSVSEEASILITDYPELTALSSGPNDLYARRLVYYPDDDFGVASTRRRSPNSFRVVDLDRLIERGKQQIKDLPAQIEERRKELSHASSFTATTLTKFECDKLNAPLDPEVDFNPDDKESVLKEVIAQYQKRLESAEKRFAELQANLPAAERKAELLRKELIDNRSFFTISASLVNSGRTNTAIKAPGLLRVSIGEGNYIDIKLTMKDFETRSEISANGTRIVVFDSPEISSFPEDDRRLINTYWGQSISVRLFIEDIHERCYGSNKIAFAEGLYQKTIYDRLAQFATTFQ